MQTYQKYQKNGYAAAHQIKHAVNLLVLYVTIKPLHVWLQQIRELPDRI